MFVIYNVKNWDQEATTKLGILSSTVYVYIQHMPHLQEFLGSHSVFSSGARLGGTCAHGEPPLAVPLKIFRIEQKQSAVKVDGLLLMQDLPQLGLGLGIGTTRTINVHVLRPYSQISV